MGGRPAVAEKAAVAEREATTHAKQSANGCSKGMVGEWVGGDAGGVRMMTCHTLYYP